MSAPRNASARRRRAIMASPITPRSRESDRRHAPGGELDRRGWPRGIDGDMLGAFGPQEDGMPTAEPHTDANSIAGLLQEVFVAEVTAARRVCQSCRETHPIGAHRLYRGAGYVLRCPAC